MNTKGYDYIIAGGGLAGCVLGRRLADKYPDRSILVVEAGPRPDGNPLIERAVACVRLHNSEVDWAYASQPQAWLGNKPTYQAGGKVLSGGSATNYGIWSRGAACDYDEWAERVNDQSWNWKALLPYFKKSETLVPGSRTIDPALHGTSGPVTVVALNASHPERRYPLKDACATWLRALGLQFNPDGNSGRVKGYSEICESTKDGIRRAASLSYAVCEQPNITVLCNTLVYKVIINDGQASGIETSAGTFRARQEVIVCAGAYRSPHLLLLSGIGPAAELQKFNIPVVQDLADVGANLHDHLRISLYWRLKKSGVALGDPALSAPQFLYGLPFDFLGFAHDPAVPDAAAKEGAEPAVVRHLANPETCHTEIFIAYCAAGPGASRYPTDGTVLTTSLGLMTPTSRGTVTLSSSDPNSPPSIDPNYYATEADRAALRNCTRAAMRALNDTVEGQDIIAHELTDHKGDSDEAIDARLADWGYTMFHPAGTCAMGKVVDAECKVKGVGRLRVVDASIIPLPFGAHYQATVYALAEKVADMM